MIDNAPDALPWPETGPDAARLHVLVTDDEPMLRSVICDFLQTLEFCTFTEATDGIDALEYIRRHRVDCLLSDIRMPRMDLEGMLAELRRDRPELIVIATSGFSDVGSACSIFEHGAHEFIPKPMDLDVLELALLWIPARNKLLRRAAELFPTAEPDDADDWRRRFETLAAELAERAGPFAPLMRHARRVAGLVDALYGQEEPTLRGELKLAALLHEIGAASRHLPTLGEARPLQADELALIHTQPLIGARLLAEALPGRPLADIVERHIRWNRQSAAREAGWGAEDRLACRLGALNMVDSLLNSRADRPAYDADEARALVQNFYACTNLTPLKHVLKQWDAVTGFYAA